MNSSASIASSRIAFVGGGNMASAIIGGLVQQGLPGAQIEVVEPLESQRERLTQQYGVRCHARANDALVGVRLVVWAVKPQVFRDAAAEAAHAMANTLHLSVAAGIRTDSMASWLGSERIVRAMPNTPALVGRGTTGLFARPAVDAADRALVEQVVGTTGEFLWLDREQDLDAVTALSGSGPAYVFYFLEAMRQAGVEMGLSAQAATRLAIGTFVGASHLAQDSADPPEVLRERVTSKGGTTFAALSALEAAGVKQAFVQAMHAAERRARELGDEFGG
jgi:pyrroline-5-carboxylate reductase